MNEHDVVLDYRSGLLDGEAKARFELHLSTCARCRAELADYHRLRDVAKAASADEAPGTRLTGTLRAELLREAAAARRPKRRSRPWLAGSAAAAGLSIVIGAFALSQKDASAPSADDALQRARALARAGRCPEAIEAYAAIERRAAVHLDLDDRAAYEECQRKTRGTEPAR